MVRYFLAFVEETPKAHFKKLLVQAASVGEQCAYNLLYA